ncbi:MAG TPA: sigma-70 family RNA polymerase sigma factor [Bryobacteraceae bacterium]|jgi:RNA polymerase sigma factor (sigma-70 family)|nr:sigma-70 family RNA polymerase sigma factor [Bryobacteraceae bacterium]
MEQALPPMARIEEQDSLIAEIVQRERGRLRGYIRRSVADAGEAEDILQDIFFELVQTYRMMKPVEQAGAWLYRVARNRIIDFFRKKRPETAGVRADEEPDGILLLEELLPSPEGGPDAQYFRTIFFEALDAALDELPASQRDIFVGHELEGKAFEQLAEETGLNVNTLMSRKRAAVLHLRERLRSIHEDFLGR